MDNLEHQIQQFWENETSPAQRREILRQLEESGMEWKDFMQQYYNKVLAGEEAHDLSDAQKSKVWQRLKDVAGMEDVAGMKDVVGIRDGMRVRKRVAMLPWMAAACVLLVVSLCIYRWGGKPSGRSSVASGQPSVASGQLSVGGQSAAAAKVIVAKNTGAGEESLTLPDHSLVLLAPGSSIRYLEHFDTHARNIQLEGRALFEVAKDSARPFTVTARGFATTALGTRFIVDAMRSLVSIRLLKGKIVVNSTADGEVAMRNVYLTPGQELRINTETKHFALNDLYKQRPGSTSMENPVTMPLSFEKTSLATVFQRLSAHYKTSILFDKAEVQGLSFTGAFEPSDELDLALKVICNMNQLTFTKESDHIVISKK